ncbi:hypothetical protein Bbelb_222740 [Branchiostoma belcheri]|nr:hypothetical protein Bbelb_222740 [Branchiostoma belcheri]
MGRIRTRDLGGVSGTRYRLRHTLFGVIVLLGDVSTDATSVLHPRTRWEGSRILLSSLTDTYLLLDSRVGSRQSYLTGSIVFAEQKTEDYRSAMGRSSGGLLILLAACIIHVDQCTCERLDYERDLCTDARVVVGNKYYTIVDDAGVTFGQAVSICGSVGGRLASTRYPSYYRAYRELMNTVKFGWTSDRIQAPTYGGIQTALRLSMVFVLDGPESPCFPTVVLDTGSRPYDSPFQLLRAGDFSTFGSIIDLDCPGDYSITYTWRVWQEVVPSHSDEMADIPAERPYRYPIVSRPNADVVPPEHAPIYHDNMITILGNTLRSGRYRCVLCVSVTHGLGVTTAAVSSWVEIALSPVNILITGGSRRSQSGGYLMGQFQEEAYTIDPDLQVEESNSYPRFVDKWDWTCRLPEGGGCGQIFSVLGRTESWGNFVVYNDSPVRATSGTFIMRVQNPHGTSGRVWLPYEQEVTLFPQGYPTCYIRCSVGDNCNYLATRAHDRLRLTAHCEFKLPRNMHSWWPDEHYDLGPEHSFYWSLKQAPDGFPGVDWGNDTRTGQYQEELIVKDHVFTGNPIQ